MSYLIPKYGEEKAKEFPMAKAELYENVDNAMMELIGVKKRDLNRETWLIVPNYRFDEVQYYLSNSQKSQ